MATLPFALIMPLFGVVIAAGVDDNVPPWVDAASRIGVIGLLLLALFGLYRRWWVPGWAYRDLEERHERLRERYDSAIDVALSSSRGVEKSASLFEEALVVGLREKKAMG